MKIYITIGNERFELKRGTVEAPRHTPYEYADIYDAYVRPSRTKIEIWNEWKTWAAENNAFIWITGRNCFHFSIAGVLTWNGGKYAITVTSTRNELRAIAE